MRLCVTHYTKQISSFFFPVSQLTTLTVSPFPQALQEKVESLQRQLHSSEKKLLSKELETEEKVTQSLFTTTSHHVSFFHARPSRGELSLTQTHSLLTITVASLSLPTFSRPVALSLFITILFDFLLIKQSCDDRDDVSSPSPPLGCHPY